MASSASATHIVAFHRVSKSPAGPAAPTGLCQPDMPSPAMAWSGKGTSFKMYQQNANARMVLLPPE